MHFKRTQMHDPFSTSAFNLGRKNKEQARAGQRAELDHILEPGYKSSFNYDDESASVAGPSRLSSVRTAGGLSALASRRKDKSNGDDVHRSGSTASFANGHAVGGVKKSGVYLDATGRLHDTEYDPFAGVAELSRRRSRRRGAMRSRRNSASSSDTTSSSEESGHGRGTRTLSRGSITDDPDRDREEIRRRLDQERRKLDEVSGYAAARRRSMMSDRASGHYSGRGTPSVRSGYEDAGSLHPSIATSAMTAHRTPRPAHPSPLSPTRIKTAKAPQSAVSGGSGASSRAAESMKSSEDSPRKHTETVHSTMPRTQRSASDKTITPKTIEREEVPVHDSGNISDDEADGDDFEDAAADLNHHVEEEGYHEEDHPPPSYESHQLQQQQQPQQPQVLQQYEQQQPQQQTEQQPQQQQQHQSEQQSQRQNDHAQQARSESSHQQHQREQADDEASEHESGEETASPPDRERDVRFHEPQVERIRSLQSPQPHPHQHHHHEPIRRVHSHSQTPSRPKQPRSVSSKGRLERPSGPTRTQSHDYEQRPLYAEVDMVRELPLLKPKPAKQHSQDAAIEVIKTYSKEPPPVPKKDKGPTRVTGGFESVPLPKTRITGFEAPRRPSGAPSAHSVAASHLAGSHLAGAAGSIRSGISSQSGDEVERKRRPKPAERPREQLFPETPAQIKRREERERRELRSGKTSAGILAADSVATSSRSRILPEIEIVDDDDPRIVFPPNGPATHSIARGHTFRAPSITLSNSHFGDHSGPTSLRSDHWHDDTSSRSLAWHDSSKAPSAIIEESGGGYLPSRWASGDKALRLTEEEKERYRPREWGGRKGDLGGRPDAWQ